MLAIVVATGVREPDYPVQFMFIGTVRLKYVALFMVLLDLLFMTSENAGGHIAHLGGAAFGWLFACNIRRRRDWATWITRPYDWWKRKKSPRRKMHVKYRRPQGSPGAAASQKQQSERINEILDKISRSGYESLTSEEKELLFRSGRH